MSIVAAVHVLILSQIFPLPLALVSCSFMSRHVVCDDDHHHDVTVVAVPVADDVASAVTIAFLLLLLLSCFVSLFVGRSFPNTILSFFRGMTLQVSEMELSSLPAIRLLGRRLIVTEALR